MRKLFITFSALLALTTATQAADLIGYWDLNGTLSRSSGTSGALSATLINVGVGPAIVTYDSNGSTQNLLPGFSAGQSLAFGDFGSIVGEGYIEIANINFTGYQLPTLSFAGVKTIGASLFSTFSVDYKIGSGSWTTASNLGELPHNTFATVSYTFDGGQLDNLSNVSVRIHFTETVNIASYAMFDNIQVTAEAVPEPSTYALIAVAIIGLLIWRRQRVA